MIFSRKTFIMSSTHRKGSTFIDLLFNFYFFLLGD